MNSFKIQGNSLIIGTQQIEFSYRIEKALYYKEFYLVLLDSDSHQKKWGQFQNLFAVSLTGDILWKAELPTTTTGDSYHSIEIINNRINAYSWCSYECIIDADTGRIIEKKFIK